MQTTVELQNNFSYSIWPIIVVLLLIILFTIYIFLKQRKQERTLISVEEIKLLEPKNIEVIKKKYIKKIDLLENKIKAEKISVRVAYQHLSNIIRYFIFEVTDIKVHNYTLLEIERLNMPQLSSLIQEYYAPEFAKQSIGNIKVSLEKTRKVIEEWS